MANFIEKICRHGFSIHFRQSTSFYLYFSHKYFAHVQLALKMY